MKRIILICLLGIFICSTAFSSDGPKPTEWMLQDVVHEGSTYVRDPYWEEYESVTKGDINGDGKDEVVVRFRSNDEEAPRVVTAVYDVQGDSKVLSKAIIGLEYLNRAEMLDVDKDGVKDLILYDRSGNHYTYITIYSFKDGEYRRIFENGTACYLYDIDAEKEKTQITIGRENWDDPEFCYANSDEKSLKEVYVWNGKEFVYSRKLSTTPLLGEKKAIEMTWQKMKKNMDEMPDDGQITNPEDEIRAEYSAKMWNGGMRTLELFHKDLTKKWENVFEKQLKEIYQKAEAAVAIGNIKESDFWLARYMGITTFNDYTERNYSDLFPLFRKREDLKPTAILSRNYSDRFVDFFCSGPNQFWGASDDIAEDKRGIVVKAKANKDYFFQFTLSPTLEAWTLLGMDSATVIIPFMTFSDYPFVISGKLKEGKVVKEFEPKKVDIENVFLQYIWPIEFYDLDGDDVPEIWMRYNRAWATGFSQVLDIYKIKDDKELVLFKRFEGLAEGIARRLPDGTIEVGKGFSKESTGHMGYDQTHFEIFEYKDGNFVKVSERDEPHILFGDDTWQKYYFGE